ncbi:MAG: sulfotransferase domain-containing protein [Methylovirgula sp.]
MRTISTLEIDPLRFASDSEIALPVMVSSHERSGTHFVINSIANNSAFRNDPHLNYDTTPLGSFHNFHDSQAVLSFFGYLCEQKCASVIKSHFSPGFFLDDSGKLLLSGLCKTIYIARNPLEAMISYHRFVNYFPWYEGPRAKRPIDFLKAAPEGRMLRYQSMQVDTILERWAFHFLSWLAIAAANPNDVLVVNYKDLDRDHAAETKKILGFIGCACPKTVTRPDPYVRTVRVPAQPPVSDVEREEIRKAVIDKIGDCAPVSRFFPELYAAPEESPSAAINWQI